MELQCSKWKIGLKIDDVFLIFLPKFWPFLQLSELLWPIYTLQSTFLVLFCLHNHFFSPVMDLQCSKSKICLKIDDFVFLTFILLKLTFFVFIFKCILRKVNLDEMDSNCTIMLNRPSGNAKQNLGMITEKIHFQGAAEAD